jgi:3-hydroxyisobutyrate dehydrogenase-like beta-hydroxyacid dehydrogenase
MQPEVSTGIRDSRAAMSSTVRTRLALSMAGVVFGIASTPVTPPLIAASGPAGCGQHAKLANQIAVGGIMLGLAEALAYAERAGLNGAAMLETLGSGTARSFLQGAYGKAMLEGDTQAGFFVDHFVKDLALARDAAAKQGLAPGGVSAALEAYRALSERGLGQAGIQALIRLYQS